VTVSLLFPIRLCFTTVGGGASCGGGAKRGVFIFFSFDLKKKTHDSNFKVF